MDLKNIFGDVIFSATAKTVKDLVLEAIKHSANLSGASLFGASLFGANLSYASLFGANLFGANLFGANLSGANLFGASLFGANLSYASLFGANLFGANLFGANLFGANLSGANLFGADLFGADLSGADLSGANLSGADLSGANLSGADLPAPTIILSASWGEISEQLCADLMEYDCWCHGNRAAFDEFARTHKCPFDGHREQRAANFKESGSIWARQIGKLCSPHDLMLRLFEEKGIKR